MKKLIFLLAVMLMTETACGTVISVSSEEFIIEKSNVISSDVMVKNGENVEKVSVIYTD